MRRIVLIDAPAVVGWQQWREIEEGYALGLVKSVLHAIAEQARLPTDRADLFAHMLLASMNEIALLIARADGDEHVIQQGEAAADELLSRLLHA